MKSDSIVVNFNAPEPKISISKLVQLEAHKDAFYDKNRFVKISDEYIIVQDRYRIVVFDTIGKYVTKIERIGKSSQEYTSILSSFLFNEQIHLLPDGGNRILVYDMQGRYIKSISLECRVNNIMEINNDVILGQAGLDNQHALCLFSTSGELLSSSINKLKLKQTIIISALNPFTVIDNSVFFLPDFYTSIFKIHHNNEISEYNFDFGDHNYTSTYLDELTVTPIKQMMDDQKVTFLNFNPTQTFWNLSFMIGSDSYKIFINPTSNHQQYCDKNSDNPILSKNIISNTNSDFVTAIEVFEFTDNKYFDDSRHLVEIDETQDNEIIIFYNLER